MNPPYISQNWKEYKNIESQDTHSKHEGRSERTTENHQHYSSINRQERTDLLL